MKTAEKGRALRIPILCLAALMVLTLGYSALSQDKPRKNPKPMTEESIGTGRAVFVEYCSGCHGSRADGRGNQALNLIPKPQNLRNTEFVSYLTDDRIYTSVSGGVRGTSMPPFELTIGTDLRWDVINYIRSLTAGDASELPNSTDYGPVSADLKNPVEKTERSVKRGEKLFLNYCASCHGGRGDGKGLIALNLTPKPRNLVVVASFGERPFIDYLPDSRIYDSVTNGVPGTSMLPWIGVFGDEDRWNIINYLQSEADREREKTDAVY